MCVASFLSIFFLQLILIFQAPVGDDLVDSCVDGGVQTIDDVSAPKKIPSDESKSDGTFSFASIFDKIKKAKSIYGSQTQRIKSQHLQ